MTTIEEMVKFVRMLGSSNSPLARGSEFRIHAWQLAENYDVDERAASVAKAEAEAQRTDFAETCDELVERYVYLRDRKFRGAVEPAWQLAGASLVADRISEALAGLGDVHGAIAAVKRMDQDGITVWPPRDG